MSEKEIENLNEEYDADSIKVLKGLIKEKDLVIGDTDD